MLKVSERGSIPDSGGPKWRLVGLATCGGMADAGDCARMFADKCGRSPGGGGAEVGPRANGGECVGLFSPAHVDGPPGMSALSVRDPAAATGAARPQLALVELIRISSTIYRRWGQRDWSTVPPRPGRAVSSRADESRGGFNALGDLCVTPPSFPRRRESNPVNAGSAPSARCRAGHRPAPTSLFEDFTSWERPK